MQKKFSSRSAAIRRPWTALALLSCLALPGAVQAQTGAAGTSANNNGPEKKRIETEVITLRPDGAVPATIVRKAGPFFLSIVAPAYRSLLAPASQASLALSLAPVIPVPDPSKLQQIIDLDRLQKKKRSAGLVDLPPGEYHLQSADNQILCTITIQ